MLRPLFALAPLALTLAACGELPTDAIGGDPIEPPVVEPITCGEPGVPVVTGITADWDDVHPDWIDVEVRGLTCGADVEGFGFEIFDGEERNITGRAWPELQGVDSDGETFVLRGEAAGCGSFQTAARIELIARGSFGSRCAIPVASAPVSVELRPFEWPAEQ